MKFVNKLTAKKYTCHDLGGTWICGTDYYGQETLLVRNEDFKNDFKPFNALETKEARSFPLALSEAHTGNTNPKLLSSPLLNTKI